MTLRRMRLKKIYGGAFPNEIVAFHDPKFSELIERGTGVEVDENGQEIGQPAEGVVAETPENNSTEPYTFDEATDPFINDGLSKPTSLVLHEAGIHTPDDLRKYLAEGKSLADIISAKTQVEKALLLYSTPA